MKHTAALQEPLPFVGRHAVREPTPQQANTKPTRHTMLRALDKVDRIDSAMRGFALLMSTDDSRISGKSAEDVECLINYLVEMRGEAMEELREVSMGAVEG